MYQSIGINLSKNLDAATKRIKVPAITQRSYYKDSNNWEEEFINFYKSDSDSDYNNMDYDDNINYLEIGKICESEGVEFVTLHPRTRNQMYSGKANWEYIRDLKENISIPVIGNGDIFTPEDSLKMIKETKCDGIQIGRGAIGNPFIFRMIKEYLNTGE